MSVTAIIAMVFSMLILWGGLTVVSIALIRTPQVGGDWADRPEMDRDDDFDED